MSPLFSLPLIRHSSNLLLHRTATPSLSLLLSRAATGHQRRDSSQFSTAHPAKISRKDNINNLCGSSSNAAPSYSHFPSNLASFKVMADKCKAQITLTQANHAEFGDITIEASLQEDAFDEHDQHDDEDDLVDDAINEVDSSLETPTHQASPYEELSQNCIVSMLIKLSLKGYNLLVQCHGPGENCLNDNQFQSVTSSAKKHPDTLAGKPKSSSQNSKVSDFNDADDEENYEDELEDEHIDGDSDERIAGRDYFGPTSLMLSADEVQMQDFDEESAAVLYMEDLSNEQQEKINDILEKIGIFSFSQEITNILIKHKENLLMNQVEILNRL